MGADRALNVVALQALLMSGIRNYRGHAEVAKHTHRVLATAASLDYVLMLVTGTAGTRIPPDDSQRAIHDGFSRAIDDALVLLRAVVPLRERGAHAFARDGLRAVRAAIDTESLADDNRTFTLIALATDLAS